MNCNCNCVVLDEYKWLFVGWKIWNFRGNAVQFLSLGDFMVLACCEWKWVTLGVVWTFGTKCSLFSFLRSTWPCISSYWLGLWLVFESHCIILIVIGRAGDPRHTSGGNLCNFFVWSGECTTHAIVISLLHFTCNLWLDCLWLLRMLDETRVYLITLVLYGLFDRLLYHMEFSC